MLALDRDAVTCDFAETYGVTDIRALPVPTAATLAQGLPATSRIMRRLSGAGSVDTQTALLAIIADRLGHIAWMFSEDGSRGKNRPPSILSILTGDAEWEPEGYDSGEDFFAAWNAVGGVNSGN